MGLDITVLGLDWGELERTPVSERTALLYEAAFHEDDPWSTEPEVGWVIPASPKVAWSGRYEFEDTLGSYKPHFWAGESWDTVREFADPELREALDGFLGPLIWWGDDHKPSEASLFATDPEPWSPRLLLCCPPAVLPVLASHWARVEPLLDGLREIYDHHAAAPGRWIADFDEFVALLRGWAELVGEAGRRGWGLLGLPA
ncbi:hypothetical protein [Streptomyces sp. NPDC018693]|uniref:hypothetical protein n=1 Tax=unclassified Streptomyces TaxID=2593676 RepID=UPI0037AD11EF